MYSVFIWQERVTNMFSCFILINVLELLERLSDYQLYRYAYTSL
jgi:hypothetical protein